ncbi:NifU family protein [Portibacter marinus]|uniref:NifU family protein n=1 Tax=Portibacter marinus TaxID=2898660 RepID=UPI001F33FADA|nr:NifU family protein [Portibacter marinus]
MSDNERKEWINRVDTALEDIRPHLAVDGGNIEVMDVTDELLVEVKWLGNCEMCSMSTMTMKAGVEQAIKSRVPEINGVVAVNGVQ